MSFTIYPSLVKIKLTKFDSNVSWYSFRQKFIFIIEIKFFKLFSHQQVINNTIVFFVLELKIKSDYVAIALKFECPELTRNYFF